MKKQAPPKKNAPVTKSITENSFLFWIFLFATIAGTLAFNTQVLDRGILARFFALSVSFGVLILGFIVYKKEKLTIPLNIYYFAFTGYTIISVASIAWSLNKGEAFFDAGRIALGFFIFTFAVYFFQKNFEKTMKWLSYFSLFMSVFTFGFVLIQVNKMVASHSFDPMGIISIHTNKNLVSSFLFLNMFFCIWGIVKEKVYLLKILFVISIILTIIVLILTRTRTVDASLILTIIIFAFFYLVFNTFKANIPTNVVTKWIIPFSLIVVSVAVFLIFLPPLVDFLLAKLSNADNVGNANSFVMRLQAWEKTILMYKDFFWFGVGGGNWQIYISDYKLVKLWEDTNMAFQRPHNDFLWVISEKGITGFVTYMTYIIGIIWGAIVAIGKIADKKHKSMAIWMVAFAIGYFLIAFDDFPMERFEHLLWLNILMAALFVIAFKQNTENEYKAISVNRFLLIPFLAICVFHIYIFKERYNGETSLQTVYQARSAQNFDLVASASEKGFSYYYSIDPFSVPLHWFKGNVFANKQDFKGALPILLEAYKYNPYNRHLLNDLGSSYVMTGDSKNAVFYYEESARISPNFDDPRLNLIVIYLKERNKEKAQYWEQSITHQSDRRNMYKAVIDTMTSK